MEFVVEVITCSVPVAARDLRPGTPSDPWEGIRPALRRNLRTLYERERDYYGHGAMYYDTLEFLEIKPGIKDGGILNDEMVFEVTVRALFRVYLRDAPDTYFGRITSMFDLYYFIDLAPCYRVIIQIEGGGTIPRAVGDVVEFVVRDMSSRFTQGTKITLIGEEVCVQNCNTDPDVMMPAYWRFQPAGRLIMRDEDRAFVGADDGVVVTAPSSTSSSGTYVFTANGPISNIPVGGVYLSEGNYAIEDGIAREFAEHVITSRGVLYIYHLDKHRDSNGDSGGSE